MGLNFGKILIAALCLPLSATADSFVHTISGKGDSQPDGYAPPYIGNGSVSTSIDNIGKQIQKSYHGVWTDVAWAGRRYGPAVKSCTLMPFGHYDDEIFVDGKASGKPVKWSQTLNTREAYIENTVEFENATVKTMAFVPYGLDMLVVKKSVEPKGNAKSVKIRFKYTLEDSDTKKLPERMLAAPRVDSKYPNTASLDYTAYAYKVYQGSVSVISSADAKISVDGMSATFDSDFDTSKGKAESVYFVCLADNFQYIFGTDVAKEKGFEGAFAQAYYNSVNPKLNKDQRAESIKNLVMKEGFDGIFAFHKKQWANYWVGANIEIPDKPMQDAYITALYHIHSMYTRWSIPVGLYAHYAGWSGRFFAFDEMNPSYGAASAGKFGISMRTGKFRKDVLNIAKARVRHYFDMSDKKYGARYPWETLEDGREGAPNPAGFWIDHVFHMSHVASGLWGNYLYSGDREFLEKNAYPVMRECAAFFYSHMLQENGDKLVVGKCTDLERLGPACPNPFFTSCGIIYNFECAAKAADILGVDADYAKKLRDAAKKLRESLPQTDEMYVPFAGCKEKSIAVVSGLFPYPVFDKTDKKAVSAAYDFIKNLSTAGNMYPMGNSICSWCAGWLSSALAVIEDNVGPEQLMSTNAAGTGYFGETWEINEPKVRTCPWFSTSAGSYVLALNQMLVMPRENGDINIATGAPKKWKDYSFSLPAYGGGWVDAEIRGGKLAKLALKKGKNDTVKRRLLVPEYLMPEDKVSADWKKSDGKFVIEVGNSFEL